MNRYTAIGLGIAAEHEKKTILILHRPGGYMRQLFDMIRLEVLRSRICRAYVGYGGERLEFTGGGTIHFLEMGSASARGLNADIVCLEDDGKLTRDDIVNVMPALAWSQHSELIICTDMDRTIQSLPTGSHYSRSAS